MQKVSASALTDFARRLLVAGGVEEGDAAVVAASLVGANLRGHDSHGVMRIPYYLQQVENKEARPGASLTITRETDSLIVADGNWGLGQPLARELMRRLIAKARTSGVALGTMIHSCHIGRLGEYCEQAAEAGMVSILMVNTHGTGRRVAPPGGTAPRLGTNPLAIGVPHAKTPLVLDFGTSATAEGKVRVKRIAGEMCPDGWLLDSEGKPTNDPKTLYGEPPGSILPMGGGQAYKGFGLALMIEVLAGALSGGVCARETAINPLGNCVYMQVIDPGAVGGTEHFAREVADLDAFVRSCPLAAGSTEITLPGDPERRTLAKRTSDGIPLDDGNWRELVKLAERLGVAVP